MSSCSCGHEDPSQTNAKEREESPRMGPRGPGLKREAEKNIPGSKESVQKSRRY